MPLLPIDFFFHFFFCKLEVSGYNFFSLGCANNMFKNTNKECSANYYLNCCFSIRYRALPPYHLSTGNYDFNFLFNLPCSSSYLHFFFVIIVYRNWVPRSDGWLSQVIHKGVNVMQCNAFALHTWCVLIIEIRNDLSGILFFEISILALEFHLNLNWREFFGFSVTLLWLTFFPRVNAMWVRLYFLFNLVISLKNMSDERNDNA